MSLLLDLPNELFYQIVYEWIDPTLFLAFTHLDNAVKFNSHLRSSLLNHYEANKRNLPFSFEWKGGYYYSNHRDILAMREYLPSFVGIRLVVKSLCLFDGTPMKEKDREKVEFLLNTCLMTELMLERDDVLKESQFGLRFLKSLWFSWYYSATLKGCLCIRNSCTILKGFRAWPSRNNASPEVKQVLNEIVANNHNLEHLTVFTTNDIFNILPVNCKQLREVTLYIDEQVEVKGIYDVIQGLPLMTKFELRCDDFECYWITTRKAAVYYSLLVDSYATAISGKSLHWKFQRLNNIILTDIGKYFAAATTALRIYVLRDSDVQTLQRTIQNCYNLSGIKISPYWSSVKNLIDILQGVATRRVYLSVSCCNVSTIIEVLKCCQNLISASFYEVKDDSSEHPGVIEELKNTLLQYPDQSVDICLEFGYNSENRTLSYKDGKFFGRSMDHYWK